MSKRNTVKVVAVGRIEESRVTSTYRRDRAIKRLRRRICRVIPVNGDPREQDRIIRFIRTGER
jgi:hypothetical protein